MESDVFKTIAHNAEGFYKEKGSKFYAFAYPIKKEEDVKTIQNELKKMHHSACHFCYAYVLYHDKSSYRINDDGEPSGTAGKPIFGQIQAFNLTNLVVFVVRYFGGTLLGTSGLIRSYKAASKDVLENGKIIKKTINDIYDLSYDYNETNQVLRTLHEFEVSFINQSYDTKCHITLSVRKSKSSKLIEKLSLIEKKKIKYLKTEWT